MHVQDNDASSNPVVSITSPSNNSTLSGKITVSVSSSSSDILSDVRLFIDGEVQWGSDDGTNFTVNTCEWPNGPHVLLVTAKSQSDLEGQANGVTVLYGRSVSPYVNVRFNNPITRVDLSEPFFEPALGQTQQVSAVFPANVDWSLQIQDANSNTVRTVSGSGASMSFNWDGNNNSGASIPDGGYTYLITAQTNGLPMPQIESEGDTNAPPMPMSANLSTETSAAEWYPTSARQALEAGWDHYFITPPPMPPVKTNGVWMHWEDVYGSQPLTEVDILPSLSQRSMGATTMNSGTVQTDDASGNYGGPASQSTRAPERKPRIGVKGEAGSFGICYKTYGTNGFSSPHPMTGWPYPLPTYVAIDGQSRTAQTVDRPIPEFKTIATDLSELMQKKGKWRQAFVKPNDQWSTTDIQKTSLGGNSIFNTCNFGLLMTHGSFASQGSTG